MEFSGDLAGAAAFANETKDFQLAVGEMLDGGNESFGFAVGQLLEHLGFHFIAQKDFSNQDPADGDQDLLDGFLFHDIAKSPGPQGPFGIEGFIVHGED